MRSRILKLTVGAFALTFIWFASDVPGRFEEARAGVTNAVSAGEATAKSIHRFHTMLAEIDEIEKSALERQRETNRAHAFGNI